MEKVLDKNLSIFLYIFYQNHSRMFEEPSLIILTHFQHPIWFMKQKRSFCKNNCCIKPQSCII